MKKKTIVLLPGYDGDGVGSFGELNKLLTQYRNCQIINYPYYRQTDRVYTLKELVSYVHKITTQRKLGSIHLIGFSLGGIVASAYAVKYPSQVHTLTLISSSTQPRLSHVNNLLLKTAYYLFKAPLIAKFFSIIYCSPYLADAVKNSPLPPPRTNFPAKEGHPVFDTLANVLHESIHSRITTQIKKSKISKKAILFTDDPSFPASTYSPFLTDLGFHVTVHDQGGHASSPDYWQTVGREILR